MTYKPILSGILLTLALTSFTSPGYQPALSDSPVVVNQPQAASKWTLDKAHSNVKFAVTHMVVSEVEGNFKIFDGSLEASKEDFSDGKVEFTVDVSSIDTDNENRDKHLKSDDFFNAEKYPTMKFVSTSFTPAGVSL